MLQIEPILRRTRLKRIMQDFVDGLDGCIRRRMEDNDNRAKKAHSTTQLAKNTEPFFEEIRT